MTYYPDLTTYEYDASGQEMLNVGWLTPGHAYRTGIVDDRVTDALKALSSAYDNQMRGVHHCEFCSTERPVILGGPALDTQVWLGSAEIRARGPTAPSTRLLTSSSTTSPNTATALPWSSAGRWSGRPERIPPTSSSCPMTRYRGAEREAVHAVGVKVKAQSCAEGHGPASSAPLPG